MDEVEVVEDDKQHFDDDCAICVAIRNGQDPSVAMMQADGAPPKIAKEFLIASAQKAIAKYGFPAHGTGYSLLEYGAALPDGSIGEGAFELDYEGRIHWISWTRSEVITRINLA